MLRPAITGGRIAAKTFPWRFGSCISEQLVNLVVAWLTTRIHQQYNSPAWQELNPWLDTFARSPGPLKYHCVLRVILGYAQKSKKQTEKKTLVFFSRPHRHSVVGWEHVLCSQFLVEFCSSAVHYLIPSRWQRTESKSSNKEPSSSTNRLNVVTGTMIQNPRAER